MSICIALVVLNNEWTQNTYESVIKENRLCFQNVWDVKT
jgi:hypothetical protein